MSLLLDTHSFLWCLFDPKKLSSAARTEILQSDSDVVLSAVSLWEISLKYSLGKLELRNASPELLLEHAERAGFQIENLTAELCAHSHKLPRRHGDPFDRMLVWHAMHRGHVLVTKDRLLKKAYSEFGLKTLW